MLHYLKYTIHYSFYLSRGKSLVLTAFSDLDWGGCKERGRTTTGYAIYLGGDIISWKSSFQKSISRAIIEAEYKTIANISYEII